MSPGLRREFAQFTYGAWIGGVPYFHRPSEKSYAYQAYLKTLGNADPTPHSEFVAAVALKLTMEARAPHMHR